MLRSGAQTSKSAPRPFLQRKYLEQRAPFSNFYDRTGQLAGSVKPSRQFVFKRARRRQPVKVLERERDPVTVVHSPFSSLVVKPSPLGLLEP